MRSASKPRANSIAHAQLILALSTEAMSYEELAEFCGFSYCTVRSHVHAMRKAGVVRISDWGISEQNAPVVPKFSLCSPDKGRDKPRPKKKSMSQRAQEYRERKKERASALQLTISRLHEPVQNVN